MEIINGPQSTIIELRIEEDLDLIKNALQMVMSHRGMKYETQVRAGEIFDAIYNAHPGKNIQLRFT